ncbi:MAG: putative DNA binding domain-containing protein [Bacteroidetes bacterium]|nr:putative DNA binding domain-containing protein [Bacteroidota bacterium]
MADLEQDRVEKTISTNDANKFGEAICSFCNDFPGHKKPGYLIVGVNDDGSRCGLPKDEKYYKH